MLVIDRHNRILDLVRGEGFASIEALAELFAVTPQTIRRDVNLLCDQGLLRRHHGGVGIPPLRENRPYDERSTTHLLEKRRIAATVARRIDNRSVVGVSIGTTPTLVVEALLRHEDLRIITNNLNAALVAATNPTFEVVIAGGQMRSADRDVVGSGAERLFRDWRVDYAIFGAAGIEEDGTLLDFETGEVRARQALAANARRKFLVADHSKFGRRAAVSGGRIGDVDALFTDADPPPHILDLLRDQGIELHVATPFGDGEG